jgi:hypothetical protein
MENFLSVLLILGLAGLAIFVALQSEKARKRREAKKAALIETARSLVRDDCFVSADSSALIGMNFQDAQIVLLCSDASGVFPYGDISSCEVVKDDVSVTQTNRGGQAMGAVVGGVLAGTVGVLAGSLTGSKRSRSRISRLELKVVVDSQSNPVYRIPFFISRNKQGADSRDPRLLQIISQLDRFHAHVVNAMRKADHARVQPFAAAALQGSSNPTNQLKELFELKQLGAITDMDYERAKERLLTPPTI